MTQNSLVTPPDFLNAPSRVVYVPSETLRIHALRAAKEKNPDVVWKEKLLADAVPYHYCDELGIVGPAMGAPAAVVVLEMLIASGTKEVVMVGACGAVCAEGSTAHIGDVVSPSGGLNETGVGLIYGADEVLPHPESILQEKLDNVLSGRAIHRGLVWSTDAPYREDAEKVISFAEQGAIAVEMEYCAVNMLCATYDVTLACALVVSDKLLLEPEPQWVPGFGKGKLRESFAIVCSRAATLS